MTLTELQEKVTALHFFWNGARPVKEEHVVLKFVEEVGEMTEQYLLMSQMYSPKYRKTDGVDPKDIEREFAKELADVLYNVALIAGRTGIDLDIAMQERFAQLQDRAIHDHVLREEPTQEGSSVPIAA